MHPSLSLSLSQSTLAIDHTLHPPLHLEQPGGWNRLGILLYALNGGRRAEEEAIH